MDIDEVVLVWAFNYCFVIIAETGHFCGGKVKGMSQDKRIAPPYISKTPVLTSFFV
jgi:hypothetical protein